MAERQVKADQSRPARCRGGRRWRKGGERRGDDLLMAPLAVGGLWPLARSGPTLRLTDLGSRGALSPAHPFRRRRPPADLRWRPLCPRRPPRTNQPRPAPSLTALRGAGRGAAARRTAVVSGPGPASRATEPDGQSCRSSPQRRSWPQRGGAQGTAGVVRRGQP